MVVFPRDHPLQGHVAVVRIVLGAERSRRHGRRDVFLLSADSYPLVRALGPVAVLYGLASLALFARACMTPVAIHATSEVLTLHAPAYFRHPVTIPKQHIYGIFFGTQPCSDPGSARHAALVLTLPRTNLGIRFTHDLNIAQARPLWSAVVNFVVTH